MPIIANLINKIFHNSESIKAIQEPNEHITDNSNSRLNGPFDIDYTKLKAKGTLQ